MTRCPITRRPVLNFTPPLPRAANVKLVGHANARQKIQLHRKLKELLPDSRSVALLGQSVQAILESPVLQTKAALVGQSAEEWVAKYLERPETHPKD